jgi:hypothetical protein
MLSVRVFHMYNNQSTSLQYSTSLQHCSKQYIVQILTIPGLYNLQHLHSITEVLPMILLPDSAASLSSSISSVESSPLIANLCALLNTLYNTHSTLYNSHSKTVNTMYIAAVRGILMYSAEILATHGQLIFRGNTCSTPITHVI